MCLSLKAMRIFGLTIFAYLMGAIPFSFLIARAVKGIDIRKVDSGNVGAFNVFKNVGPIYGIIAGILDIGKGFIPVAIAREAGLNLYQLIPITMAVIAGHNWTIFLKFQGGQGLAPTLGAFLNISTVEILWAALAFVIGALLAKIAHPPGWLSKKKNFGGLMGFVVYTTIIFSKPTVSWGVRANYFAVIPVLLIRQFQGTAKKRAFLEGFIVPRRRQDERD